jgi:hypothetical protein
MVPTPLAVALGLVGVLSVAAVALRARAKDRAYATPFSLGLGRFDAGGEGYAADRLQHASAAGLVRVESNVSPFGAAGVKTYSYGGQASEEMRKTGFLDSR